MLGCLEFANNYTSQNLRQKIQSNIQEWNLEDKINVAVSDNVKNVQ